MRARGCGPAPAADVRRGQMQPASAAERPDPDGRSARAARPGRGARLWAGRRRHADGGELRASAAGNGGGRPGAGSPQAAGEGLWPAPPLAHDFFFHFQINVEFFKLNLLCCIIFLITFDICNLSLNVVT